MSGVRILNGASGSQLQLNAPVLPSWKSTPGCPAIFKPSPRWWTALRLIEGSHCVSGKEFGIELALREALGNAVVHGNQEDPEKKVHLHCRCGPGEEISIVVTDQGKGFDLGKVVDDGFTSDSAAAHGHGIQLMKAYMDDVHFERGGSEVHMRKRSRSTSHS